jgi:hypothetical protein
MSVEFAEISPLLWVREDCGSRPPPLPRMSRPFYCATAEAHTACVFLRLLEQRYSTAVRVTHGASEESYGVQENTLRGT